MKILFYSKHISLFQDLDHYWTIVKINQCHTLPTADVLIIDTEKASDHIFDSGMDIWGITSDIQTTDFLMKFHEVISIPYDIRSIMLKLAKLHSQKKSLISL